MKARVVVKLKESVLDPQGQTIERSLKTLGYGQVAQVRQGKYFEIEFQGPDGPDNLRRLTDEIARKVLSNPIIESYEIQEIA